MKYCIYCGSIVEELGSRTTVNKYYCSKCMEYLFESEVSNKDPFLLRRIIKYILGGLALLGASIAFYILTG